MVAPVFRVIGPCETWISAGLDRLKNSLPPPGTTWEQNRRQQRWLVKNHPEASLGNLVLQDYLAEESSLLSPQQESSSHTCFFSLGELTDTTLRRNTGVPLVVTVAGSASNILRLARLVQERWTWSQEPNVAVRLAEVANDRPTLWIEEELGPIRRVKCIVDHKRYNPTRWLAVQRDSGTTMFQPEYRKAPTDGSLERDASRIVANPLFHLSKQQTGDNIHSDVSFNPGTRSNPPQLAIIDERGFWSIWDVGHTRVKTSGELSPSLRVCGHIDRGVLEHLPHRDRSTTKWHGILWVGRSEDNLDLLGSLDLDADNEELNSQAAFPPLQRSSSLVIYNQQQVRLLDLTTGLYLPDLIFCRRDSLDSVLDIQITHDPQYFYVLTTSKLFIVRAYSRPGVEWDKPEKVWLILFSTPHFRSPFDQNLRLVITQGASQGQTTSIVFICSSITPWVELYHVEFSLTDPQDVRCQTNLARLGSMQNNVFNSATQVLRICPTPITIKAPELLTGTGQDLAQKRARLYQIAALRPDMSLVSALCVFSLSSSVQISVPNIKVGRRSRAGGQRTALRRLSSNFVVDDDSAMSEEDARTVAYRYVKAFYQHLHSFSDEDYSIESAENGVFAQNPFDAAHHSVVEALNSGLMPLRTLFQVMPDFKEVYKQSFSTVEWEGEVGKLNEIHSSVVVHTLDSSRSRLYFPISTSLEAAYSKLLRITNHSLRSGASDDTHERRVVAISEQIAYDLYLSSYGIGYSSLSSSQGQADGEEGMVLGSQTETLPSSPLRFESPASSIWSQRSNSEAAEGEDPSMALLRAYTGTGKFVPEKSFELLDKWRLGAEPADYVFDLDRSGDADVGKLRKAKRLAREHRKRRRTATLLQYSQEPELPATQPAPDTTAFFSSQPRGMTFSGAVWKAT
ncbi:hypothetical protein NUW58_g8966 [Xylaria curta]|uniref:Uncharacterized protein n=1 Tax=Xylaria curta TaxID=42375 RepID=A0ACC1N4C9_9PEZI|nr:hypothetical protein NUW58_g8966 [Xylaria curta]